MSNTIYSIWGSNTNIGKTLASVGIAYAAKRLGIVFSYIKPVQTGYPKDSDARLVALASGMRELTGPHATTLLESLSETMQSETRSGSCKVLCAWREAVSPHLAVLREGRPVGDMELIQALSSELSDVSRTSSLTVVETAGGVASPSPSGSLQCDALRPLRLPCLLVGDPRLGGISSTISSYESLLMRGYDVDVILFFDHLSKLGSLDNADAVDKTLSKSIHRLGMKTQVVSIPACPPPLSSEPPSASQLDPQISNWLKDTESHFVSLINLLQKTHQDRLQRLQSISRQATQQLWWPFTQHASLKEDEVQVIDSRCGQTWQVFQPGRAHGEPITKPLLDGCSSWWTQAVPNSHLQSEVARSISYAAGRYLHVMFPEIAHEPAVALADRLLTTVGKGWASRVFFSDDGSTAIEIALKMAFRKSLQSVKQPSGETELIVLGLTNAYHGDTLGAMDCVAPSVFNHKDLQAPWYTGRGLFLDPPQISLVKGQWKFVHPLPSWMVPHAYSSDKEAKHWSLLKDVLEPDRDGSSLSSFYRSYVEAAMDLYLDSDARRRFAAVIIEPMLQGAGGMNLIDPQFQKAMIQVCRSRGVPVIFDEVMTGIFRLGTLEGGGRMLRERPDIACFAKILSAGAMPLAVTLTTEDVFNAFKGDTKLQALLHGHSYTAYPIGCSAAVTALDLLTSPDHNPNLCTPSRAACGCSSPCGWLIGLWDEKEAALISKHPLVSRVAVIGTVIAVELAPLANSQDHGSGHAIATASRTSGGGLAVEVSRRLRAVSEGAVFCRPLGSVLYFMVPPTIERSVCNSMASTLQSVLDSLLSELRGSEGDKKSFSLDAVVV